MIIIQPTQMDEIIESLFSKIRTYHYLRCHVIKQSEDNLTCRKEMSDTKHISSQVW